MDPTPPPTNTYISKSIYIYPNMYLSASNFQGFMPNLKKYVSQNFTEINLGYILLNLKQFVTGLKQKV